MAKRRAWRKEDDFLPTLHDDRFEAFLRMQPRRCETGLRGPYGDCLQCGAANGQSCLRGK